MHCLHCSDLHCSDLQTTPASLSTGPTRHKEVPHGAKHAAEQTAANPSML